MVSLTDPSAAVAVMQRMMELLRDRPSQVALRASACLYQLLAELAAGSTGEQSGEWQRSPVDLAISFMESHYHRGIGVSDVAACVGLDPSYLLKLFRRQTGMSIRDYLIATRLRKAKVLLKDPRIAVTAAAQSVGFRNYASFEKTFRKSTGRSPSVYREELFY